MFKKIHLSNNFFYLIIFLEVIILISLSTSVILFKVFSKNEKKSNVPKAYTQDTATSSIPAKKSDSSSTFSTGGIKTISITKTPDNPSPSIPPAATGLPSKIIIPKLGINTNIEHVGLDNEGRMDIPKSFTTVAWYKLGYRVGDNGSAVMSGHYDTYTGAPAVFWNISKLSVGDIITVIDTNEVSYTFTVKDKKVYDFDKFPLREVFATAGTPGLNLITCSGEWNKNTKNYSTRTVIYASKN